MPEVEPVWLPFATDALILAILFAGALVFGVAALVGGRLGR